MAPDVVSDVGLKLYQLIFTLIDDLLHIYIGELCIVRATVLDFDKYILKTHKAISCSTKHELLIIMQRLMG